jgi:hypothetical protein
VHNVPNIDLPCDFQARYRSMRNAEKSLTMMEYVKCGDVSEEFTHSHGHVSACFEPDATCSTITQIDTGRSPAKESSHNFKAEQMD